MSMVWVAVRFERDDPVVLGVATTRAKAQRLCDRDLETLESAPVLSSEDWREGPQGWWRAAPADGIDWVVSCWRVDG